MEWPEGTLLYQPEPGLYVPMGTVVDLEEAAGLKPWDPPTDPPILELGKDWLETSGIWLSPWAMAEYIAKIVGTPVFATIKATVEPMWDALSWAAKTLTEAFAPLLPAGYSIGWTEHAVPAPLTMLEPGEVVVPATPTMLLPKQVSIPAGTLQDAIQSYVLAGVMSPDEAKAALLGGFGVPEVFSGSGQQPEPHIETLLTRVCPALKAAVHCPGESGPDCNHSGTVTVSMAVQHLNDAHRWSFDQIADWLETLPYDLTFQPVSIGD